MQRPTPHPMRLAPAVTMTTGIVASSLRSVSASSAPACLTSGMTARANQPRSARSVQCRSAGDVEAAAGDVARLLRQQEGDHVADVARARAAAQGLLAGRLGIVVVAGDIRLPLRFGIARR